MTLLEMSALYADSAAVIRLRIKELRSAAQAETDAAAAQALRRRVAELEPILREARDLAAVTAHYYDRTGGRHGRFTLS